MKNNTNRKLIFLANCIAALCVGTMPAFSAFAAPMTAYFKAVTLNDAVNITFAFTLLNTLSPIFNILGGSINDIFGPKVIMLIGGLLFGTGYIFCGSTASPQLFIFFYGVVLGAGHCIVYSCIIPNTVKLFPERPGLASGTITALYGLSSVITPVILRLLLRGMHITDIFRMIGIVFAVLLCIVALINKKQRNDQKASSVPDLPGQARNYTWHEMIRQTDFYIMIGMILTGAFAGVMLTSSSSLIAAEMMGFSETAATLVVSVIAVFNMLARILGGMLSDKIGPENTLLITFTVLLAGGLCLGFCTDSAAALFYIGISMVGYGYGSTMGIFPGFTSRKFGKKYNSTNFAIMFVGFSLGSFFGPTLMQFLRNSTGRYQPAFFLISALAVIGLVLVFVYKRRNKIGTV